MKPKISLLPVCFTVLQTGIERAIQNCVGQINSLPAASTLVNAHRNDVLSVTYTTLWFIRWLKNYGLWIEFLKLSARATSSYEEIPSKFGGHLSGFVYYMWPNMLLLPAIFNVTHEVVKRVISNKLIFQLIERPLFEIFAL